MGDKGYTKYGVFRQKNKFSGGALTFINAYNEYITMDNFGEKFLISPPPLSVHNLIIGQIYVDARNRGYIRNLACPND
jgi:hypothetical protein